MNQESIDDKITIIEGPPPAFEPIQDGWALGLSESPFLFDLSITRLRAFNGPALVERCHRAWRKKGAMHLQYRNEMGLEEQATIVAARALESEDGHMLVLWIRREVEDIDVEVDIEDDDDTLSDGE